VAACFLGRAARDVALIEDGLRGRIQAADLRERWGRVAPTGPTVGRRRSNAPTRFGRAGSVTWWWDR